MIYIKFYKVSLRIPNTVDRNKRQLRHSPFTWWCCLSHYSMIKKDCVISIWVLSSLISLFIYLFIYLSFEEWRALIAIFLLESKRSVGLSDIGSRYFFTHSLTHWLPSSPYTAAYADRSVGVVYLSCNHAFEHERSSHLSLFIFFIIFSIYLPPFLVFSVPRPIRIPTSVKLIFIMKTDPSNRFILKGDGNAAKARYNMQADSYQESVWVDKWRDDIALFLIKQQWSIPSVGKWCISYHAISNQYE